MLDGLVDVYLCAILCYAFVWSELNDDVSGGIIDDVDGPLLLKAILANDAQALQSSTYHMGPPPGSSGG